MSGMNEKKSIVSASSWLQSSNSCAVYSGLERTTSCAIVHIIMACDTFSAILSERKVNQFSYIIIAFHEVTSIRGYFPIFSIACNMTTIPLTSRGPCFRLQTLICVYTKDTVCPVMTHKCIVLLVSPSSTAYSWHDFDNLGERAFI